MPRDPNGNTQPLPGTIVSSGDTVLPSQHNPALVDLYAMMTQSLSRDGQGGMRANLDMSTFKAINLANGTNPSDAVNLSQLNAFVALTANLSGQVIRFPTSGITLQFASSVITTNAGGGGFVAYPTPFIGSLPTTIACGGDTIATSITLEAAGQALHGFSFVTFGPSVISSLYRVNWLSIGVT